MAAQLQQLQHFLMMALFAALLHAQGLWPKVSFGTGPCWTRWSPVVDAQSQSRQGGHQCLGALDALCPLSSPASVEEVSLGWEVGSETGGDAPGGLMDSKSNPPHWQQSQTQSEQSSIFFFILSGETNKKRSPRG